MTGEEAVVVPAVAPSAIACIRSLGRRGVHTIAVSENDTAPEFHSTYCDERCIVPDPLDDGVGYAESLLSLAKRPEVRAITPIREADVWALSRNHEAFAEHVAPLWPSRETLRTVYDRVRLIDAAEAAGVTAPETRTLDAVDDWDHEQIVKPRYALLANEYVDSVPPPEIAHPGSVVYLQPGVEPDREALCEATGHTPIVQEYVPGEEFALWALYDRGEVVATCQKHQLRGYTYAGNTSVARQTTSIPSLETAGRTLLDALDWHGPASVQFVRNENTGAFTLLEVNPRFWVSLQCAIQAGADFASYFWRLAGDEPMPVEETGYDTGVATHLLRGELLYIASTIRTDNPLVEPPSIAAATRAVVSSIYRQPNFDYLCSDDPVPFVRDTLNAATELVGYVPDRRLVRRKTQAAVGKPIARAKRRGP